MFCRSQSCSLRLLACGSFAIEGNRSLFLPRTVQEIEVRNRTFAAGERGGVRNDCARRAQHAQPSRLFALAAVAFDFRALRVTACGLSCPPRWVDCVQRSNWRA
jgi:hypothetical protein